MGSAVALLAAGCGHPTAGDPRQEPPMVKTAVVENAGSTLSRSFTGTVAARVQSELSFRVSGKVLARLVTSGQQVTKGQALMRLDDLDFRLASTAQQQTVLAAAAYARQASEDETRDHKLSLDGAIPVVAYDRTRANAEAARAQLRAAQAQAQATQNSIAYTLLVADADGVIVETLAEPGQVVAAGQAVVKLAQHGPREAVVQLPETLRPAIGAEAQAELYGRAGLLVPARLRELSSAADPLTRTFQARYVLGGGLAEAPIGATVTVLVPPEGGGVELRVPIGALFDPGGGPGVWTVLENPKRVSWRAVKVDHLANDSASLSAGVAPGERVVSLGAHFLHEGQGVRLASEEKL